MIALQNRVEQRESHPLQRMAEAALSRYGLAGAEIRELPFAGAAGVASDEARIFGVSFPIGAAPIHPYLGRLAGKIFTLSISPASDESRVAALAWVEEMAALCRDSDEDAPEPVPACDGSLVTLIALGEDSRQCIVYR